MPRIAKRLYGPAQLGNTTATRYTVPANQKAIVRHIHVSNPTAGAVTFTLSIGADAAGVRLFDAYSIAAGAVLDHYGYYTLEETEIIAAHAGTAASLVLEISGDEVVLG